MNRAQAGTLESMDCLVTLSQTSESGISIDITGASAARFKSAMEKKIKETLSGLGAENVQVTVQDNGALDIVLGARVEAAYKRLKGGAEQ